MPSTKPDVAVIIPFYQSAPGLLTLAVSSVYQQNVARIGKVTILVVDDGSPSGWRAENLADAPPGFELKVIERPNGGVSSARNAGLDAVDASTEFVAFLDSDDRWMENHLDLAVSYLGADHDLFFSNCDDNATADYFSFALVPQIRDLGSGEAILVDGESLFDHFLTGFFAHTSFSVYRRRIASDLRFEETLKLTCEDQIFFLRLARRVARAIVVNRITGERGYGVSIYRSSLAWDSPTLLSRVADQIAAARYLVDHFDLRGEQRQRMRQALQAHIDELLFFCARKLRYGQISALSALAKIVARHPTIVFGLPKALAHLVSAQTHRRLR